MAEIIRCADCTLGCNDVYRRTAIRELFDPSKASQRTLSRYSLRVIGCQLSDDQIDNNIEALKSGEAELHGG